MGGKSSAPAPDPRMGEAALRQIALAERQWQNYVSNEQPWIQDIVNRAVGTYEDSTRSANELNDYQLGMMRRNDDRYWGTAVPFEDELLSDVRRFDSDAYKEAQVGMARADVRQAFDSAEREAQRTAGRFGLNRVVRASTDVGLERAKAEADAANKTRQAAEQIGLSTKMQMYGGMRGLAGLGATNAQLGLASIDAAQAGAGGMSSTGFGMIGANNQSFGSAMGGMSAGIQGLGSYTGLQQNAAQLNNANDPFASILGAGAQLGAAWLGRSDRRLKADIVHVGVDEATGLNLYEFKYLGGTKRYRGVMADEVEAIYPQAVYAMPDGYKAVNYTMLGLEMVEVEGEPA